MCRRVNGRRRRRRSGHGEFDGVQFLAHVSHDQPLIDPVDFLSRVVDQLHHFGLWHALLGVARDERDARAIKREMRQIQGVVLLEKLCSPLKALGAPIGIRLFSRTCGKPGRKYEDAVKAFQPYDSTKEINDDARKAAASLVAEGKQNSRRRTFIYVNNRLEGNALATIAAMLDK